MKKILVLFVFFLVLGTSNSTPDFKSTQPSDKTTIVLVNPGVFYLKSIVYMTKHGIIKGDNIEYLAVFYTKSEVKYSEARDYVEQNDIKCVKFREVYGDLDINNIYFRNSCTDEFYDIFQQSDAIIFLGGWDIPPVYYGQKTELTVGINTPNRHLFELSFLFHLLGGRQNTAFQNFLEEKPDYPILGICLGMQTMNVAAGGDMYQDIPSDIYELNYVEDVIALGMDRMHRNYNKNLYPEKEIDNHSFHHVVFTDQNLKEKLKLVGSFNPLVVSSHHQAVHKLGRNIVVAATSIDGKVIEALINKKYKNVIGVQFHPEFYTEHDPDSVKRKFHPDDKEMMTEHEVLIKNKSYQFNLDFWANFLNSVKSAKAVLSTDTLPNK